VVGNFELREDSADREKPRLLLVPLYVLNPSTLKELEGQDEMQTFPMGQVEIVRSDLTFLEMPQSPNRESGVLKSSA